MSSNSNHGSSSSSSSSSSSTRFGAPPKPPTQGHTLLFWTGQKFFKFRDLKGDSAPPPGSSSPNQRAVRLLMAGGGAGAIAKTCVAPLERVKLLLQIQGMRLKRGEKPRGIAATFRDVYRFQGVRGFWKGNVANVIRIIPNKVCMYNHSRSRSLAAETQQPVSPPLLFIQGILFMSNDYIKRAMMRPGETTLSPGRGIVAGAASGALCILATYPLDFVRTQLMAQEGTAVHSGILDVIKTTVQREGPLGLYRGLAPTLAGILPYAGVNFGAYDFFKTLMPKDEEGHTPIYYKLACGASAGLVSQTVSYPLDTVRRRMTLQTTGSKLYKNSFDCVRQVAKNEGILALFRGVNANVVRAVPNVAIQFAAYEQLKLLLRV